MLLLCPSRESLLRLLADEAPADDSLSEVRDHLDGCPACQALLDQLSGVTELGQMVGSGTPAPDLDRLQSRLRAIPRLDPAEMERPARPPAALPEVVGPYRVVAEVGRGGIGVVLLVEDVRFHRRLAVKVLRPEYAGRRDLVHRFVEEAQITAGLQHPGIPPVHDQGTLGDGQPYFAMKWIRGQTLADLLADRPAHHAALLGVFAQVCQAVAYAHSQRVIHRDLKPSNVMVGEFNEVQVMDWGLAKCLNPAAHPVADASGSRVGQAFQPDSWVGQAFQPDSSVRQAFQPDSSVRQAFQPDSSEGVSDRGDAAAATRAGTVMGTPAYMAPEQARGEPVDERADVFGLGAILCEILTGQPPCSRSSLGDPGDAFARLDGCGGDADLIGLTKRCLAAATADRPRHAGEVAAAVADHQARVEQRLRQAEQDRAVAEGRAAADRKRRRMAVWLAATAFVLVVVIGGGAVWSSNATRAGLDQFDAQLEQFRWADARASLDVAAAHVAFTPSPALRRRLREARTNVGLSEKLVGLRLRKATLVGGKWDNAAADSEYAAAFAAAGLGLDDPGTAQAVAASAIRPQLLAALDDWAATTRDPARRQRLRQLIRTADPESAWRNRFDDAVAKKDAPALEQLAREALAEGRPPRVLLMLGMQLERRSGHGVPVLRAATRQHPSDFWLHFWLGTVLSAARPDEAVGYLLTARALRPDNGAVHQILALTLQRLGRLNEAEADYRAAVQLDPGNARFRSGLASVLAARGKLGDAIAEQRRAVADEETFAPGHAALGGLLTAAGKYAEALKACDRAVEIDPRLAEGHCNRGAALARLGQLDEALLACEQAIRLDHRHATACANAALIHLDRGKLRRAEAAALRAIELNPRLAPAHLALAEARRRGKRIAEAVAPYRRAVELDPADPAGHHGLGLVLCQLGQFREAATAAGEAARLQPNFAEAHRSRGNALERLDQLEAAEQALLRAHQLDPRSATALNGLGVVYLRRGRPADARAVAQWAIDLDARLALAHTNLGVAHFACGNLPGAIAAYRLALGLDPQHLQTHLNLGEALRLSGQHDEAIRVLTEAVALGPPTAELFFSIGAAEAALGRLDEAVAAFRQAVALKRGLAQAHAGLGHALLRLGRYDESMVASETAVGLNGRDLTALLSLAEACLRRGRDADAARWCRRAAELAPNNAAVQGWVGRRLLRAGEFADAAQAIRRALKHLRPDDPRRRGLTAQLQECGRLAALESRLEAVVTAEGRPAAAADSLNVARLCEHPRHARYAAAVRFFADAFAQEPGLVNGWDAEWRRRAAVVAVLAAAGRGKDATGLGDRERAALRQRGLAWLRQELAAYRLLAQDGPPQAREAVRGRLRQWQKSPDLATVRGDGLARLTADERRDWARFWEDVDTLLGRRPVKKG